MKPPLRTVLGQPSWQFRSRHVEANLTQLGGHLGPVTFRLGRRKVTPYSVAPWAEESVAAETPAMLRVLRGDFFCAPFGGNATAWRGERHPPHGESANAIWKLEQLDETDERVRLHASLEQRIRRGRIDKYVTLLDGHTAIYQQHVLSGSRGPMCVGHHAMLAFPPEPGSGRISTSALVRRQVFPGAFESPEQRGYQSLKPGAVFGSLARVPLLAGGTTDLSRYPARRGFEDLVLLTADATLPFAWTAVAFPRERYVWFSLRDPRQLRHTVFWISNGGRHYPPWNGRHTAVMGLEDVTSYFHLGLAESAGANPLNRRGLPTTLALDPKSPTTIRSIMGVAAIPAGFERVQAIHAARDGIELVADGGQRVRCALDLAFLVAG
jgi:hypothetical protein